MNTLAFSDPGWQATFPYRVTPLGFIVLNLVKYPIYYDPKVIFWGKEYWGEENG